MSDDELLQKTEAVGDFFEISGMREHAAVIERVSARIREQRDLLDECERALEAIIEDQTTGGGDDTFPIAKTLLAKLRKERADE